MVMEFALPLWMCNAPVQLFGFNIGVTGIDHWVEWIHTFGRYTVEDHDARHSYTPAGIHRCGTFVNEASTCWNIFILGSHNVADETV